MSKATDDVLAERQRQIEAEGWTDEHDDQHQPGDLAVAGAAYAYQAGAQERLGVRGVHYAMPPRTPWPWDAQWWKPKNARRDLVRAAALLIAEIERMDRAELKTQNVKSVAILQGFAAGLLHNMVDVSLKTPCNP